MHKETYLETIQMIDDAKKWFESYFEKNLNLIKVGCPLFVKTSSGLQDNLTGREKAIGFTKDNETFEIVHSLAKWKREALGRYSFPSYKGLYTDMKAIRKDEVIDNIHSIYVEQWDWEKVINESDRNLSYLKDTVRLIYKSLKDTSLKIQEKYNLNVSLPEDIYFITSQELEEIYPDINPDEREEIIIKEKGAVFIIGIGDLLNSGIPHDLRSPDYDDWELNGDLLVYNEVIGKSVELSSMGIRVSEKSLVTQLEKSNNMDRINLPYHQKIINKELPYTIGGGIGLSRVLMFLLQKRHIAEVQASSWNVVSLKEMEDLKLL